MNNYLELCVTLVYAILSNLKWFLKILADIILEVVPTTKKQIYFSGSGALSVYQLGYAKYLQQNLNIDEYKVFGSSGGTIPCVLLSGEEDIDKFFKEVVLKYNNKKEHIPFINTLDVFVDALREHIGDDFYLKVNKNLGGISAVRMKLPFPKTIWFNSWYFTCNEDLFKTIKASATIPLLFTNFKLFATIGNKYFLDSGLGLDFVREIFNIIVFRFMDIVNVVNTDYIYVSPWNHRLFSGLFFFPWHTEDYVNALYKLGYEDAENKYKFMKH